MALALGLALAGFWPRPGDSQAPAGSTAAPAGTTATAAAVPSVESRTAGCPTCAAMAARLPADEFARDPHTFACRSCHDPHVQKTPAEWRQRCTTPDCHPRPWPRTVFHRVRPQVFVNCLNCHQPHIWTLNGQNCLGCHAAQLDTLGTGPGQPPHDYGTFSHKIHHDVDCQKCHDLSRKHAVTVVRTKADCEACHHGPPAAAPCATCHTGRTQPTSIASTGEVNVPMAMSVWKEPHTRKLPFAHERHRQFECKTCHGNGSTKPDGSLCITCHDKHHQADADCATCHRPAPVQAHPLSLHATGCAGSGCHKNPPFTQVVLARNFCLTCHQDQADHNPGQNCAGCHKISAHGP